MSKYILLYNGPATPMEDMTEEASKAVMAKWGEWIESTGPALVDVGLPMANATTVVDDGSAGSTSPLNGYSIVEAGTVDEAKDIVKSHPFLSESGGKFSVEIHELMPMDM